ncbi:very-long-chain aldehyde decarbonylase CER1-like [Andrographis paniculata]|uniref:very-long-chain aldehyde decarbonylase CER1-like n=1 Tax=Andrographis paniculata TaxID=175694 RepID=UPI0021E8DB89|nr:very-long-chain aldehyde decarbonylase CER1-like [Andrographis paniculata]
MATTPGVLTDWPWKNLGSFKYIILAPWGMQSLYSFATRDKNERDYINLLVIPFLLSRALHNQIWISFSRHRTAKGNNRIVDKTIEFDQVDRESNWDDQILLNGILFYFFNATLESASFLPAWRTDGVIITMVLHAGPVEYLYYWLHRALHHHYLYSRYHSHHHSSIVTEPITSVIHPFAEHVAYFLLFAIPLLGTVLTGTASLGSIFGYITYIDLMNNMGHCNFEFIPKQAFSLFPPLKYLMYTPSFHSLHHTQFRTNYSLFMPFYDYIHGTMDTSSDALYESSLKRHEEYPDVVHLTHLTTPESIFHLQVGFASFASRPQNSKWYIWLMWPLTCWSMVLNFIYGHTFIVERNLFEKLKLQSWVIPRYSIQYFLKWQGAAINDLIEEAILEADARGAKVLSLGLLNQGDELNKSGALYIERHPKLNIKVVDGSSLAVAVVLNSIPRGTSEVLFSGSLSKLAFAIVSALSHRGIQVATLYENVKVKLSALPQSKVVLSTTFTQKVWIIGDGVTRDEQLKAPKGTLFIPFSQFPPKKVRKDGFYYYTPSLLAPTHLKNLHSCENWLPRRVMSAWRVAGIVHALEGWNVHECGDAIFDVHKIWEAALKHGFRPSIISNVNE